jgi:hypothetical protein
MASISRTSVFSNSTTQRGIHAIIGLNFTQRESVMEMLFDIQDSSQVQEHTLTMGGAPIFVEKAEGADIKYTSMNEGFLQTYTYVDYAAGFRITRRLYINDLYDSMEKHAAELGRMAYATRETVLASHFNNAFSSSFTGADGVSFINTAHVREDGSTYSNLLTAADLSRTSLEQMLINFRDFRDGAGKRLQLKPSYLVTSSSDVYNGWRLLGSTHDPESDTNAINPVNDLGLDHVVSDYLTDADAWFLGTEKEDHSLIMFDREPFWSEHIFDFDSKDIKYSGMMAFSSGWGDPRGWMGSAGS